MLRWKNVGIPTRIGTSHRSTYYECLEAYGPQHPSGLTADINNLFVMPFILYVFYFSHTHPCVIVYPALRAGHVVA